jgi:hypothetical protein
MTTALKSATLAVARARKPVHHESLEQRALIDWARLQAIPAAHDVEPGAKVADYLFAIPNGGARSKVEAGIMKAEGVKPGVHDLQLPLARGIHLGLWIEMKFGDNKLSEHQIEWQARMVLAGWKCLVCWSALEAIDAIKAYLQTARSVIHPPRARILTALDDAEGGELAHPKRKAIRSPKYLAHVRAMPCASCGAVGRSQAAHPNTGKGMGQKADDNLCFPLCGPAPGGRAVTPGLIRAPCTPRPSAA